MKFELPSNRASNAFCRLRAVASSLPEEIRDMFLETEMLRSLAPVDVEKLTQAAQSLKRKIISKSNAGILVLTEKFVECLESPAFNELLGKLMPLLIQRTLEAASVSERSWMSLSFDPRGLLRKALDVVSGGKDDQKMLGEAIFRAWMRRIQGKPPHAAETARLVALGDDYRGIWEPLTAAPAPAPSLNLRDDPEGVREALREMRDFDESQWTGCEGEFTLAKAEKELDAGELDSGNRAVIYGSDGTHRYYVKADGTMIFSSSHSSSPQATQKAEQLGFTIE